MFNKDHNKSLNGRLKDTTLSLKEINYIQSLITKKA